jgi:hypothetical protein
MQDPPFKLRLPIHHTSCLHRGRPRPRQHANWLRHRYITTTSFYRRSLPRLGLIKGVIKLGVNCAATRLIKKNAARSAYAPLKNNAAVRGSRLKITTNIVSMLRSVIRAELLSSNKEVVIRLSQLSLAFLGTWRPSRARDARACGWQASGMMDSHLLVVSGVK